MMWIIIMLVTLGFMGGMVVYLINRFTKFQTIVRLSKGNKKIAYLLAILFLLIFSAILIITIDFMNYVVVMIHLGVLWIAIDALIWLIRKLIKNNKDITSKKPNFYLTGVLAFLVTIIYMSIAWYLAHNVWEKNYTIETTKELDDLRVILFADAHIGTTFNGEDLVDHVASMQKSNPDIVVIAGDFVDDDTSKEDMIAGCKALKNFDTPYGVYYVFGNHDKGYYGNEYRGFGRDELVENLEANGVVVLEDESELIDGRFYLIGRQDRSEEQRGANRASMDELTANLDAKKFMLVLDHQPNDYDAQVKSGVDLVLSGHTHGGQLFPVTYVGEWIGANDKTYGIERRENTTFIVTSGISDWAIKFKTGCRSEYVVIDIAGK